MTKTLYFDSKLLHTFSYLYRIQPIFTKEHGIESLTSYICGLAEKHGVTTGTLISNEIIPLLGKAYMNKSAKEGGNGFYDTSHPLNGLGNMAEDFSLVIERLTSVNGINLCTLLKLKDVLPNRGLLRNKKAWCPICLNEWKVKRIIHEPLVWYVREARYCSTHNIILSKKCANCLKEVPIFTRKTRNGYCSICGEWLGHSIVEEPSKCTNFEKWKSQNIKDLVNIEADLLQSIDKKRIKEVLIKAINCFSDGDVDQFVKKINVPKSTFFSWYKGHSLPSLPSLLGVCYFLGISLKQFFLTPLQDIVFSFPNINCIDVKAESKVNPVKHDTHSICKQLEIWAYNDHFPPLSLSQIANKLGCDRKLLNRKAPELCKFISQRYYSFIEKRTQLRVSELKSEVVEAVITLCGRGVYPSRRKVENLIGRPGAIKEEAIRTTWHNTILF